MLVESHDPEQRAAWIAAFVAAQAAMPDIAKTKQATIETKKGGSFSYKYAELPDIITAIRETLATNGLGFAQSVEPSDRGVAVITRIYHTGGHVETFGPVVLPHGDDARAAGSAITYARRYGLVAALGIAAEEDDDGASAGKKNQGAGKSATAGASSGAASTPAPSMNAGDGDKTGEAGGPSSPAGKAEEIERLASVLGWSRADIVKYATSSSIPARFPWTKLSDEDAETLVLWLKGQVGK